MYTIITPGPPKRDDDAHGSFWPHILAYCKFDFNSFKLSLQLTTITRVAD